MRKILWTRGLILGIIILFVGAGVFPNISGDTEKNYVLKHNNSTNSVSNIDDWPMYRHDASHSGYSNSTGPETNTVLWKFNTGGEVYSSPAVVDGKVYFGSNDKKLYCLNADTGEKLWEYIAEYEVKGGPAIINNKVYFIASLRAYCLNASTGAKIWSYKISYERENSPTIANGKFYYSEGETVCLNADTGNKIWSKEIDGYSPTVANNKIYITSFWGGKVYCLNAITGDTIWEISLLRSKFDYVYMSGSPAVADGNVYFGARYSFYIGVQIYSEYRVYCLNAVTGAFIYNSTIGNGITHSSPAVAYGKVFVGTEEGTLFCLNADTGKKRWEYTTGSPIDYSSPAVADGKVYFYSSNGKLYCLNTDTGVKLWDYVIGVEYEASPSVAEGKLYIGSKMNKLYCFEDNHPPEKPERPQGASNGPCKVEYGYFCKTTDVDWDQIYYMFDWGDGNNSGWIGPYTSSESCKASHIWNQSGNYTIKVQAKDMHSFISDWSDPLIVTMPYSYSKPLPKFLELLFQRFPNAFPILRQIVGY